jgi:hypothetical protein
LKAFGGGCTGAMLGRTRFWLWLNRPGRAEADWGSVVGPKMLAVVAKLFGAGNLKVKSDFGGVGGAEKTWSRIEKGLTGRDQYEHGGWMHFLPFRVAADPICTSGSWW